jgi:hypothetical protein
MIFTLTYDGELKTNGTAKHKQEIRRLFHRQLLELWKGTPFEQLKSPAESLTKTIGKFRFFPLVSVARKEMADLKITMLRPGQGPGYIVGQGGDIDNRLKTLLDSLRMPDSNQVSEDQPGDNETPFFCLLEDDILISDLSISTDRLLEHCESNSHVKLFIRVQINNVPMIGAGMILRMSRI